MVRYWESFIIGQLKKNKKKQPDFKTVEDKKNKILW